MKTYLAEVKVMPLTEILDPQGKAVCSSLHNIGYAQVQDVRVGKNITLHIQANSEVEAKTIATESAQKLLANLIMESFEVSVVALP